MNEERTSNSGGVATIIGNKGFHDLANHHMECRRAENGGLFAREVKLAV